MQGSRLKAEGFFHLRHFVTPPPAEDKENRFKGQGARDKVKGSRLKGQGARDKVLCQISNYLASILCGLEI